MHFSPAVRPLLQADRPEWSVASDAEGGSGERCEPYRTTLANRWGALAQQQLRAGLKGAGRSTCPTTQAPQARGAQRVAVVERLGAFEVVPIDANSCLSLQKGFTPALAKGYMAPLTRRQLLQHTAAGGGILALAGCTTPNVPGLSDGESVPKPFTNDAYTASYTTAGRWLQEGHDGGRTSNAASTVPHGDVDVAWLRRPGDDPHGATAPIVGPGRVYIAYSELPDDADQSEVYLAGFDAESGEQQLDVQLGTGRAVGLALADETLLAVTRGPEYEQATLTALARDDGSTQWTAPFRT